MGKKKIVPPEWPRARSWLAPSESAWLVMEPSRLAPVGGVVFALGAMLFYFVRQLRGAAMAPGDVIVGVLLTFVVAYAATGVIVYYVLRAAEPAPVPKKHSEPVPPGDEPGQGAAGRPENK
jgi:hypothetical protein